MVVSMYYVSHIITCPSHVHHKPFLVFHIFLSLFSFPLFFFSFTMMSMNALLQSTLHTTHATYAYVYGYAPTPLQHAADTTVAYSYNTVELAKVSVLGMRDVVYDKVDHIKAYASKTKEVVVKRAGCAMEKGKQVAEAYLPEKVYGMGVYGVNHIKEWVEPYVAPYVKGADTKEHVAQ